MNFDFRVGNGTVDSGTNYSGTYLVGASGGASSTRLSNQDVMRAGQNCFIRTSGDVFQCITQFMNYSNAATNKTVIHRLSNANQSTTETSVTLWRSTAAINIITMGAFGGATMAAGTIATLYGIQAA
jgi:spore germination protein YaaH